MIDTDIISIFRNIAIEESEYAPSFTIDCLLEVEVIMENNHEIVIYCGEKTYADCSGISPDGHFGINSTMISPISDIKEIHLKFR